MRKFLLKFILIFVLLSGVLFQISYSMPNPWTDCGRNLACAKDKAGFSFSLDVKDYYIRAMKDMIEYEFLLKDGRLVTMRVTVYYSGKEDISGVYENYPVNKTIKINKEVGIRVRGNEDKYFVANYASKSGYYSTYCPQGMNDKDIKYLYKIINKSEKTIRK